MLDELVAKNEGIENGKMLYEVIDYQLPTLDAITLELSHMPEMFWSYKTLPASRGVVHKTWLTISDDQ